jgi:hypothetical protein
MEKVAVDFPVTLTVITMTTPNNSISKQPQPNTLINGIPYRYFSVDDQDVATDWLNAASDRARAAIVTAEEAAFQTAQAAWTQEQQRQKQEQDDAQRRQQEALATQKESIFRSYADDGTMNPSDLTQAELQMLLQALPASERRVLLAQLRATQSMNGIQTSVNALARDAERIDGRLQEVTCHLLAEQLYADPRNSRGFLRGKWFTVIEIKDKMLAGEDPDSIFNNVK